jgi:hypothetical protein
MMADLPTQPSEPRADLLARVDALAGEVGRLAREVADLRALLASSHETKAPMPAPDVPFEEAPREELPALPDPYAETPEEVLTQLFRAATMEDGDDAFAVFVAMMHPVALEGPRAESSLRYFQWRQLRKNVREYLTDPSRPDSFTISEQRPRVLAAHEAICKVFVASSRRMAVPVALRRLADRPSAWRVEVCSL